MSPVGINGISAQGKGVNGVQTKQVLSDASEVAAKGVYDATTLSAVDADLAVGNIKSGVTIFGFLGTYAQSLAGDILGSAQTTDLAASTGTAYFTVSINSAVERDIATNTQNYSANSMAVAVAYMLGNVLAVFDVRLYMDGVLVTNQAGAGTAGQILMGTRALSGSKICKLSVYNTDVSARNFILGGFNTGVPVAAGIGIGSIKLV
uniref:Uncharacterized protein n=1 Tax=viral metagenome TaxID=1070528 RepID=A0A6M3IZW8_9ZZZZ